MTINEKLIPIQKAFYEAIGNFVLTLAEYLGYPENPGIRTSHQFTTSMDSRSQFLANLPIHKTVWPPMQKPETLFEVIFGPAPKLDKIPRYFYESKDEGFYNFYIENYKNSYFLPDWFSEFLQTKLNICLDITVLETTREVLFLGFMIYAQIVILRIALSWFISINPYQFPWCYIAAAVDWTEDVLQGIIPAVLGINITGTVFLGILGIIADSLNHLVFTMPFLPSEGQETILLSNNQTKDILVFHYLPYLWFRDSIPNEIREFWYNERPDILKYFLTEYKDFDINFLPNSFLKESLQKIFPNGLNSLLLLKQEFLLNTVISETEIYSKVIDLIHM